MLPMVIVIYSSCEYLDACLCIRGFENNVLGIDVGYISHFDCVFLIMNGILIQGNGVWILFILLHIKILGFKSKAVTNRITYKSCEIHLSIIQQATEDLYLPDN